MARNPRKNGFLLTALLVAAFASSCTSIKTNELHITVRTRRESYLSMRSVYGLPDSTDPAMGRPAYARKGKSQKINFRHVDLR